MSSTIEITKTCEWCGNKFIARKCTTRYCSKRCAEHAYKDAKRKEHVVSEQAKASQPKNVDESHFMTPSQCAQLLGVSRRSIYNYLASNSIPYFQFKGKTLISRASLNSLFEGTHQYKMHPTKEKEPITEFYTSKEVQEKYGVSNSGMYKIAGKGAYSDAEVSFANDLVSKVMGKNRFSKKRQAEFAARERQRMADRVKELAERMHLDNVEVLTDASQRRANAPNPKASTINARVKSRLLSLTMSAPLTQSRHFSMKPWLIMVCVSCLAATSTHSLITSMRLLRWIFGARFST